MPYQIDSAQTVKAKEERRVESTSSQENTPDPCFVSALSSSHTELIQSNNLKLKTGRQWLS